MRHYGTVCPQFWTGRTGRLIRTMAKASTAGKDVQRVALYLMTSPHANMIGLYYLPAIYLSEEVGIAAADAVKALRELSLLDFSFYDTNTEHVWVKEMARFQVGEALAPNDGKVKAINRLYQNTPANAWLSPFFDRYGSAFHLTSRRSSPAHAPSGGPSQGPPLGPSIRIGSGPVLVPAESGSGAPAPTETPNLATPDWVAAQWNQIPGVVGFNGKMQGAILDAITIRLREHKLKAWWADYFQKVQESDWLCGRNEEGWAAPLVWAMGPKNISKVLAGGYPNRKAAGGSKSPAAPSAPCNHHPGSPCHLSVSSTTGSERRCGWHLYLGRHPEIQESRETFERYWVDIAHEATRKGLTVDQAWAKTNGTRLDAAI